MSSCISSTSATTPTSTLGGCRPHRLREIDEIELDPARVRDTAGPFDAEADPFDADRHLERGDRASARLTTSVARSCHDRCFLATLASSKREGRGELFRGGAFRFEPHHQPVAGAGAPGEFAEQDGLADSAEPVEDDAARRQSARRPVDEDLEGVDVGVAPGEGGRTESGAGAVRVPSRIHDVDSSDV